eukprot:gene8442-5920_t
MAEYDVRLCRYDLSQGMARSMSLMILGEQLDGIWHTSIVVFGKEFYFNGGVGVEVAAVPGTTPFGTPYASEPIGRTSKTLEEFLVWVSQIRRNGFGPMDYNLLENNCNHFTQAAAKFLVGVDIPPEIREMIPRIMATPLGRMLGPMITQTVGAVASANGGSAVRLTTSGVPLGLAAQSSGSGTACGVSLASQRILSEEEEADLELHCVMLESCDVPGEADAAPSAGKLQVAKLLQTMVHNVLKNPASERYRSISTSSDAYTNKLFPFEEFGVVGILHAAGFRLKQEGSGTGQGWKLLDVDASPVVLERVLEALQHLVLRMEAQMERETCSLQDGVEDPSTDQDIFRYCPPGTYGGDTPFLPLSIGPRGGCSTTLSLFSILQLRGDEGHCFGKCRFTTDMGHLEAWVCTRAGLEEKVRDGSYLVLCVRKGCESRAMWVPAVMTFAPGPHHPDMGAAPFIFHPTVHCGVARAFRGGQAHPGVMESSGRCVIPFGGRAVDVTAEAQVLCDRDRLPAALRATVERLYEAEDLLSTCLEGSGYPIGSFDELCNCPAVRCSTRRPCVPLQPRRDDTTSGDGSRPKLLVCHDMRGGYLPGDYAFFSLQKDSKVLETCYTPEFLRLVDYFVYFSHHRISVPPREWIDSCHRSGVPILGTVLLEGGTGAGEVDYLLTNPQRMAKILTALVDLCDLYEFDGYLINCEATTSPKLAKRMAAFCDMLRRALRVREDCQRRAVVWYDAMTISGALSYQNGLTAENAAFFDVCDGIMTNYFWGPTHLHLSSAVAAPSGRSRDCFIGVDVFGRHMRHNGGFASGRAATEATEAGLSVGLFAPGWTMEEKGGGSRAQYLRAESQLWSSLQIPFLERPAVAITDLPRWTCFTSGAGRHFCVNGSAIALDGSWCQLSGSHLLPPCRYTSVGLDIEAPCGGPTLLPTRPLGGGTVRWAPATWVCSDTAWFGDRSLELTLSPREQVQLLDWFVPHTTLDSTAGQHVAVDVAVCAPDWSASGASGVAASQLAAVVEVSVSGSGPESSTSQWRILEGKSVPFRRGPWFIVRFVLPVDPLQRACITGIALGNTSSNRPLQNCRIGGVALLRVDKRKEAAGSCPSPLTASGPKPWPDAKLLDTLHPTEKVLLLSNARDVLASDLQGGGGTALIAVVAETNSSIVVRLAETAAQEELRLEMVKYVTVPQGL